MNVEVGIASADTVRKLIRLVLVGLMMVSLMYSGVTEKHFKEKLPRVLGLGNTPPDPATMTTGIRGLMFGDYMVPGQHHHMVDIHCLSDWLSNMPHPSSTCLHSSITV